MGEHINDLISKYLTAKNLSFAQRRAIDYKVAKIAYNLYKLNKIDFTSEVAMQFSMILIALLIQCKYLQHHLQQRKELLSSFNVDIDETFQHIDRGLYRYMSLLTEHIPHQTLYAITQIAREQGQLEQTISRYIIQCLGIELETLAQIRGEHFSDIKTLYHPLVIVEYQQQVYQKRTDDILETIMQVSNLDRDNEAFKPGVLSLAESFKMFKDCHQQFDDGVGGIIASTSSASVEKKMKVMIEACGSMKKSLSEHYSETTASQIVAFLMNSQNFTAMSNSGELNICMIDTAHTYYDKFLAPVIEQFNNLYHDSINRLIMLDKTISHDLIRKNIALTAKIEPLLKGNISNKEEIQPYLIQITDLITECNSRVTYCDHLLGDLIASGYNEDNPVYQRILENKKRLLEEIASLNKLEISLNSLLTPSVIQLESASYPSGTSTQLILNRMERETSLVPRHSISSRSSRDSEEPIVEEPVDQDLSLADDDTLSDISEFDIDIEDEIITLYENTTQFITNLYKQFVQQLIKAIRSLKLTDWDAAFLGHDGNRIESLLTLLKNNSAKLRTEDIDTLTSLLQGLAIDYKIPGLNINPLLIMHHLSISINTELADATDNLDMLKRLDTLLVTIKRSNENSICKKGFEHGGQILDLQLNVKLLRAMVQTQEMHEERPTHYSSQRYKT